MVLVALARMGTLGGHLLVFILFESLFLGLRGGFFLAISCLFLVRCFPLLPLRLVGWERVFLWARCAVGPIPEGRGVSLFLPGLGWRFLTP